jgi:hypothetical protein
MKCAFMDRECDSDCVANVEVGVGFHFQCVRLDSMYKISWTLSELREGNIRTYINIDNLNNISDSIENVAEAMISNFGE